MRLSEQEWEYIHKCDILLEELNEREDKEDYFEKLIQKLDTLDIDLEE